MLEDGGVALDEGAAARGCGEDVAGASAELGLPTIDVAFDELQALLLLIEVPVHGAAAIGFGAGAGDVEFAKDGAGSGVGVGSGDRLHAAAVEQDCIGGFGDCFGRLIGWLVSGWARALQRGNAVFNESWPEQTRVLAHADKGAHALGLGEYLQQ